MLMYISHFFEPRSIIARSYKIDEKDRLIRFIFEDGSCICVQGGKVTFKVPSIGSLSVIDTNLGRWLKEIVEAPDKYIPHLLAGAVKLFAINTGLIDYDFEDGDVRDVISYLGV
jgi:hypothetical protein